MRITAEQARMVTDMVAGQDRALDATFSAIQKASQAGCGSIRRKISNYEAEELMKLGYKGI